MWDRDSLRQDDWLVQLHAPTGTDTSDAEALRHAWTTAAGHVDRRLREGPGFAVVRGLALDGSSDGECTDAARRLGRSLGEVRPSGASADRLVTAGTQSVGEERGDGALPPHTDRSPQRRPPRVLGLLCVRPAMSGGESVLVSGATVHNRLLTEQPGLLRCLYQQVHFGRGDGFERLFPVFRRPPGSGRLETLYNRHHIERGQYETGHPVSGAYLAALDAFDEILTDPRTALRFTLLRGDFLLVNNRQVLHGRTAFTDPHDPLLSRCLVRMWAD
ncbi:TauD/TfdA family dioxygenase [Streptomyces sp. NPDC050842]|uniref:TauD/TfdA family dioxygenase n=1 Tax=Streptomyces sp. NPDC050842 TaxID=3365636 RepID=UPI0037924FF9